MNVEFNHQKECCIMTDINKCACGEAGAFIPALDSEKTDAPCCGLPAGPASSVFELPGYNMCRFVESFKDDQKGRIPVVSTRLNFYDWMGAARVRIGIHRNDYKIAPGLYCTGNPSADSPVLVTANYKLSFDSLRKKLSDVNVWILVCDTRGINVWCAAGKGTFSAEEVARTAVNSRLQRVVNHRKLILPQLAANGVSAHKVKKLSGFEVIWGPVRARDIAYFLNNGMKADREMRLVTFSMYERVVLTPLELGLLLKPLFWILAALFIISGIGSDIFSLHSAWTRWLHAASAFGIAIISGALFTPIFLPWIPGFSFAIKGAITGIVFSALLPSGLNPFELSALILVVVSVSSYLAMNFTGSTPFTSPSGVEKEMRKAIPVQAIFAFSALILWVCAPFI